MSISRVIPTCMIIVCLAASVATGKPTGKQLTTVVQQITAGPKHHFFGYIGHVRTIPWNASGRYIVALRTDYQNRMPAPGEAAEIVLLDTHTGYAERVVDHTRAWNFQQGTMLYWNPQSPETQFFSTTAIRGRTTSSACCLTCQREPMASAWRNIALPTHLSATAALPSRVAGF